MNFIRRIILPDAKLDVISSECAARFVYSGVIRSRSARTKCVP